MGLKFQCEHGLKKTEGMMDGKRKRTILPAPRILFDFKADKCIGCSDFFSMWMSDKLNHMD